MYKITCTSKKVKNEICIENSNFKNIRKIAKILVNNISFDKENTVPVVSSIAVVDSSENLPSFEYVGCDYSVFDGVKECFIKSVIYSKYSGDDSIIKCLLSFKKDGVLNLENHIFKILRD